MFCFFFVLYIHRDFFPYFLSGTVPFIGHIKVRWKESGDYLEYSEYIRVSVSFLDESVLFFFANKSINFSTPTTTIFRSFLFRSVNRMGKLSLSKLIPMKQLVSLIHICFIMIIMSINFFFQVERRKTHHIRRHQQHEAVFLTDHNTLFRMMFIVISILLPIFIYTHCSLLTAIAFVIPSRTNKVFPQSALSSVLLYRCSLFFTSSSYSLALLHTSYWQNNHGAHGRYE